MDVNLHQEKLEDMRRDMLIEQRMRIDPEFAIEHFYGLKDLTSLLKALETHMEIMGHSWTRKELLEYLLEL